MIIEIRGMGAEQVLLEITQDQHAYWSNKPSGELLSHIMRSGAQDGLVPPDYAIEPILNSIRSTHKYGGYIDESSLVVTGNNGAILFRSGLEDLIEDDLEDEVNFHEWIPSDGPKRYYVLWTSEETDVSTFITVDDENYFDIYSLKLAVHEFDGGGLVELISYKGICSETGDASLGTTSAVLLES